MSNERRLRKRVTLSVYLTAIDTQPNVPLGHIVEINAGGFLLLGEHSLTQLQQYSLNIQLPKTLQKPAMINLIAKVVRTTPSAKAGFYESAFEISYASLETKRIIEQLQRDYHLNMPPKKPQ